jgi:hypothetical protein
MSKSSKKSKIETLKFWLTSLSIPKAKIKVSHEYFEEKIPQWKNK